MKRFIAKAAGVSELVIDADVLLFDGEDFHLLAGPAAEVWRSVPTSTGVEDVVRRVQRLHPGDLDVPRDVRTFIEDLVARGLVEEQPASSDRFFVRVHVAWCGDDDGSVLLADLRSGQRFQLSASAADIWSRTVVGLDSPNAAGASMAQRYTNAPDDLGSAIADLHESLLAAGLIERSA